MTTNTVPNIPDVITCSNCEGSRMFAGAFCPKCYGSGLMVVEGTSIPDAPEMSKDEYSQYFVFLGGIFAAVNDLLRYEVLSDWLEERGHYKIVNQIKEWLTFARKFPYPDVMGISAVQYISNRYWCLKLLMDYPKKGMQADEPLATL